MRKRSSDTPGHERFAALYWRDVISGDRLTLEERVEFTALAATHPASCPECHSDNQPLTLEHGGFRGRCFTDPASCPAKVSGA